MNTELTYAEVISLINEANTPYLFLLDYERTRGYFISHPLEQQDILFDINGITNTDKDDIPFIVPPLVANPISADEYARRFEVIRGGLLRGDTFLANLTAPTEVTIESSLREIFSRTQARYRLYVPGRFICFSPEIFITIDAKGVITSHPMKGTIDASIPDAAAHILNDYKESAEHATIVDLIRNDLNKVAQGVHVEQYRYLTRIERANTTPILQVSSKIIGQLSETKRYGDILDQLLPAGSISGAPKEATTALIARAEGEKRGYYTGVVGYFDGSTLDVGVMIRFIEETPEGTYRFRSGGGITINSQMQDEYNEVIQKVYVPQAH